MNECLPKNHVAELLKQLEELKQKKAHKEKKLMRIKKCVPPKFSKTKNLNNSCISSTSYNLITSVKRCASTVQVDKTGSYDNLIAEMKNNYLTTEVAESLFPFICSESSMSGIKKENKNISVSNIKYADLPTNKQHCYNSTEDILKSNEVIYSNNKTSISFQNTPIKLCVTSPVVFDNEDSKAVEQNSNKRVNPKQDFYQEEKLNMMAGYLNYERNVSMSSCGPFVSDIQATQNNIGKLIEPEYLKQTESVKNFSDYKFSPFYSSLSPTGLLKLNFDDFNFPKFSTPTDDISLHSFKNFKEAVYSSGAVSLKNRAAAADCSKQARCSKSQIFLDSHRSNMIQDSVFRQNDNMFNEKVGPVCNFKKRKLYSYDIVSDFQQKATADNKITTINVNTISNSFTCGHDCDDDVLNEKKNVIVHYSDISQNDSPLQHEKAQPKVGESEFFSSQMQDASKELIASPHSLSLVSSINETDINLNPLDSKVFVIPGTEGQLSYIKESTIDLKTSFQSYTDCQHNPISVNPVSRSEKTALYNDELKQETYDQSERFSKEKNGLNQKENSVGDKALNMLEKIEVVDENCKSTDFDVDSSFLEDSQNLDKSKQIPYMNEKAILEQNIANENYKSDLKLACILQGTDNELILDGEIILFSDVKYAFIQHLKQIHIWCFEKSKWVKIFYHEVEDRFCFEKMCISKDDTNLVIVMLLRSDMRYCLQFLLFEKDMKDIKLIENTHWLEESSSHDSVLLCGLEGLMFATAEHNEVSLHVFISLKESPQLMTVGLGPTDVVLCSLCKIVNLPNALLGVTDSKLYVWHVLEARLVTEVSLHPHEFSPIKNCFWATVENGLIYFLTTCDGAKEFQVCQLLAANLATGFCRSVVVYSTLPAQITNGLIKVMKATYLEPFLVVAHSHGVWLWSVSEEFCCAAISSRSQITTVAVCRDVQNWGLVAFGDESGCLYCYTLLSHSS